MVVNTSEENQRKAQQIAMGVYIKYRAHFDKEEAEKRLVNILSRNLHITKDYAQKVVKELWN